MIPPPKSAFPSFPPPPPPPLTLGAPSATSQQQAEDRTVIVGRGISIQGAVTDAERLVVEGTVQSELIKAVEIAIADGGLFKGTAHVERALVSGAFDGDLSASGELLVSRTGRLTGRARYGRLVVEDGAEIFGILEVST